MPIGLFAEQSNFEHYHTDGFRFNRLRRFASSVHRRTTAPAPTPRFGALSPSINLLYRPSAISGQ